MGFIPPKPTSSSTPGLPVWTYTAGAMGAGLMKTDTDNWSTATVIDLSDISKNGIDISALLLLLPPQSCVLLFTDSTGKTFAVWGATVSNQSGFVRFGITALSVGSVAITGDYQVSFAPVVPATFDDFLSQYVLSPVVDGTYTVGLGGSQNGTITVTSGIITAIQEAQP